MTILASLFVGRPLLLRPGRSRFSTPTIPIRRFSSPQETLTPLPRVVAFAESSRYGQAPIKREV